MSGRSSHTAVPKIIAGGLVAAFTIAFVYTQQGGQLAEVQQRVVEGLRSQDKEARAAAVASVLSLQPEETPAAVRGALIELMDNQTELGADLRARGVARASVEDPEFVASVQRAVARLEDPSSIPALARAMGSTFVTVRPLAQFGEPAAPYVLDVVESIDSHYSAVYEGLIVLRFMFEKQSERPLSVGTVERIRGAARSRLIGPQYFTVLWRAMDLASVLGDQGLLAIMRDLASNPNEAILRGIADPSLVEKTQRRAADLLAGRAPLPRPDF